MMPIWNLTYADGKFSMFIRKRDGRCMNPLCLSGLQHSAEPEQLTCSHYFPRGNWMTRFDPENCIALCWPCHEVWERNKSGKYKNLMIRLLGILRFNALVERAETYQRTGKPHLTRSGQIMACRKLITNAER